MHRNDINTQILTSLPSAAMRQRLVTVAEFSNVTLYGTTKLCSLIQVSMHEGKKSKSNQTGVVTSSGGGDLFEWTDAVVVLLYNNL